MRTKQSDPRIGERIRYFRRLAGKSQRQLAGLAGFSDHSLLGRIERGEVSADNRFTITAIADALGRPVTDLTGVPTPAGRGGADVIAATTATVRAFVDADLEFPGDPALARPVDQLAGDVAMLVRLRVECDYAALARRAPGIVGALHAVATTTSAADDRKRSLMLLVEAAEAAALSVRYTGQPGSAAMIAERARQAAQEAGDPVSLALADWARAHAALGCGLNARAHQVAQRAADALLPHSDAARATEMLGMLYLTAGFAQAGSGQYGAALGPLAEAAQLAQRTGETKTFGLYFGPTNVSFWRLALAVDGGQPDAGVELARGVNSSLVPSASRQACFHADLGRGLAQVGRSVEATRQLRAAHRIAPQRIGGDPLIAETVAGLVDQAHRRAVSDDLRTLAERIGVPA